MIELRQSTAGQEIPLGQALDSTDGNSPEPSLTIANTDIKLWKWGATTLVSKNSGGATYISNGVYYLVLDATDTNTLGGLVVFVHVAGALAMKVECAVVTANWWDSKYSTDKLDTGSAESVTAAVTTDAASRTASQADVSDIPTVSEFEARTLVAANYFDVTTDEVTTDAASRTASKADVSDIPTVAEFEARTIVSADYLVEGDTLARVTLVDTVTTNSDMRGTNSAALASVCTETRLAELDAANLPADIDSILTDTGTTIPDQITALANYDPEADTLENSKSYADMLRLIYATTVNKSDTDGTKFRDDADTKYRVVATVDVDGNRTAVTKDGT